MSAPGVLSGHVYTLAAVLTAWFLAATPPVGDGLDDEAVFEFYDRRIPADVCTQRDFEKWWKTTSKEQSGLLTMTADDLLDDESTAPVVELVESSYPKTWEQGDQRATFGTDRA